MHFSIGAFSKHLDVHIVLHPGFPELHEIPRVLRLGEELTVLSGFHFLLVAVVPLVSMHNPLVILSTSIITHYFLSLPLRFGLELDLRSVSAQVTL